MPTPRGGLGVAAVDGKIYAIGGLNGDTPVNSNEKYDPLLDQWTVEAPMPTARSDFAIAVFEGKIYVIGGTFGSSFVANNEAYDPVSNTWETKASMPTPRADLTATVVNDSIYLIGGKKYSNISPYFLETDENEVYDPINNTWSTKSPMLSAVFGYASAVLNDKVYFVGGSKAPNSSGINAFVNSVQVYDPPNDKWSLAARLPSAIAYGAAAATEGYMAPPKLYLFGGYTVSALNDLALVYNPGNDSWTIGDSLPSPRAYLGIVAIDDIFYTMGGFDGKIWLAENEEYTTIGYGTVPPSLQLTSPGNQTYSNVTLSFSTNRVTDWIGYSLDSKANVTVTSEVSFFNLAQGGHSIVLYGNDSLGNMGTTNKVFFSIDRIPPEIKIFVPLNQSYGSSDIQLRFTVNKPYRSLSYSLDGQAIVEIDGNVTLPALTNGSHRLTIYAVDEVGNSGSKTVYFSIMPFPTILAAALIATIIIVVASVYLFMKRRKGSRKIDKKAQERIVENKEELPSS